MAGQGDADVAQAIEWERDVFRVVALPAPGSAVRVLLPGVPWVELAVEPTKRQARRDLVVWRDGRLEVRAGLGHGLDEVPLARLVLPPNTAAITQAHITDVREFPRVWESTGYVLGVAPGSYRVPFNDGHLEFTRIRDGDITTERLDDLEGFEHVGRIERDPLGPLRVGMSVVRPEDVARPRVDISPDGLATVDADGDRTLCVAAPVDEGAPVPCEVCDPPSPPARDYWAASVALVAAAALGWLAGRRGHA